MTIVRSTLLLAVLCLSAACATGVSRVELWDPMKPPPKPETAGKESRYSTAEAKPTAPSLPAYVGPRSRLGLLKIRDGRPDVSSVGVKKNAWGSAMGKVDLEEGVSLMDVFTGHVRECFAQAGYDLEPVTEAASRAAPHPTTVSVELRSFWTEFMPGVWVVDAASNVQFDVQLLDPRSGLELWSRTFKGKGKRSGMAVTGSMFESSLNEAYAEAMQALYTEIMSPAFRKRATSRAAP